MMQHFSCKTSRVFLHDTRDSCCFDNIHTNTSNHHSKFYLTLAMTHCGSLNNSKNKTNLAQKENQGREIYIFFFSILLLVFENILNILFVIVSFFGKIDNKHTAGTKYTPLDKLYILVDLKSSKKKRKAHTSNHYIRCIKDKMEEIGAYSSNHRTA